MRFGSALVLRRQEFQNLNMLSFPTSEYHQRLFLLILMLFFVNWSLMRTLVKLYEAANRNSIGRWHLGSIALSGDTRTKSTRVYIVRSQLVNK